MITQELTDFIISTDYDALPENVIKKAKLCFIDFLGVTLKGSATKSSNAIASLIKVDLEADSESTIIGKGKANALEAGLANGISAHSLDLDDGHRQGQLHPGVCVIPAALSLCEAQNKTTEEFINSVVVGYQVAIIMGTIANPEHREKGFHTTGTCGTLGAAAAASKALDLNWDQVINSLGLAGTQAAGLLESDHSGCMGKHLHAGKAAQSGILSALLARNGFSGSETILEGNEGFLKSMAGIDIGKMALNHEILDMEKFRILETYFKIYPVCRHLHSSIDALLHIINKHHVSLEDIEEITVKTYKIAADHDEYHPTTVEAIRQSLPISLAIISLNNAHESSNQLNNLLESDNNSINQIIDGKVENISQKISIECDNEFNKLYPHKRPADVEIITKNGLYRKRVDLAYGEPENPLDKSDVMDKFQNLNPKVNNEALRIIDNIESYKYMNDFMNELNSYLN